MQSLKRRENETIELRLNICGKPVLLDTMERMPLPVSLIAKMDTEKALNALADVLIIRGVASERVEAVLVKLVSDPRANLALVETLAQITAEYARALRSPLVCMESIHAASLERRGSDDTRLMLAISLFEQAKAAERRS